MMSTSNNKAVIKGGAWSGQINTDSGFSVENATSLLQDISSFDRILKDDRRSLVKLGEVDGQRIVAKQPRDKNDRKWMRLMSLFYPVEARRTFYTLIEFEKKGIESLKPLCFIEKKKFGMVIDSWLLYQYREGRESTKSDLLQIVQLLQVLHSNGYRHEDPNFGNFLVDNAGVMFLIDCRGKSRSGLYSDYYDYMSLEGLGGFTQQEVEELVDVKRASFGYYRAQFYRGYRRVRSKWKVLIGRKKSKNQRH